MKLGFEGAVAPDGAESEDLVLKRVSGLGALVGLIRGGPDAAS